jgi:flagellar biosynthetic protein FliS
MTTETITGYRAAMFDGEPNINWLRPGWRGLRLYGRRAKAAILDGNILHKAEMLNRADQLLTLMGGILNTDDGSTLGPILASIYAAMHLTLLRANVNDDISALDDFERALETLDREMSNHPEMAEAA